MLLDTRGLVLRSVDYKENDRILTLFTADYGKIAVRSRGCRRRGSPLAAGSQLLTYSELTLFSYRDRCSLNSAEPLELFWNVRKDVEKVALGSYFAEVLETTVGEGQGEPALLSLILNSLYALDQLNKPQALVKGAFELKFMALVGFEPLLSACAVCGAPEPQAPRFDGREGLLRCGSCCRGRGEGLALTPAILAAMRHIVYGDPKRLFSFRLPAEDWKQFGRVCEGFLTTQLDRGFHTLDFYHSLTR
ncbi:MAG TPA: DNA repair protein RecO [Candidatus Flavonifractor merdigallinarum]|uniref:DNA repair protein RecO n=1 Tax=Candidatus Flavonifractor merdigallinarum TaxID=2838589 RepID=A0A9D1YBL4_9FIRM|nr:DNA repair protein RecO [Candidatus Flavonifractor merdigallinarum]